MKYLTLLALMSQSLYACDDEANRSMIDILPPEMVYMSFVHLDRQDIAAIALTSWTTHEFVSNEYFRRQWAIKKGIINQRHEFPDTSSDYASFLSLYFKWNHSSEEFTNKDSWLKMFTAGCESALNQYYIRSRPVMVGLLCNTNDNLESRKLYDSGINFLNGQFKELSYFASQGSPVAQNNLLLTYLHLTKTFKGELKNINDALEVAANPAEERELEAKAKKINEVSTDIDLPSIEAFMGLTKRFGYQANSFARALLKDIEEGTSLSKDYAPDFVLEFTRVTSFEGIETRPVIEVYIPKKVKNLVNL